VGSPGTVLRRMRQKDIDNYRPMSSRNHMFNVFFTVLLQFNAVFTSLSHTSIRRMDMLHMHAVCPSGSLMCDRNSVIQHVKLVLIPKVLFQTKCMEETKEQPAELRSRGKWLLRRCYVSFR